MTQISFTFSSIGTFLSCRELRRDSEYACRIEKEKEIFNFVLQIQIYGLCQSVTPKKEKKNKSKNKQAMGSSASLL